MLHDKPIMTFGSGGNLDYAIVANHGPFCLALKYYGIAPGAMFSQPGGFILFRVRTHDASEQLNAVDHDFDMEAGGSPAEAFELMSWEKGDPTYQSTSLALHLDCAFDPKDIGAVVRAIDKLDVPELLLKKVESVIQDKSQLAISKAGIEAYLATTLRPMVEKMREQAMAQAQEAKPEPVQGGTVYTAGELLAKLAKKQEGEQKKGGSLGLH